jgi:CO dehydrogenase maturation factor
VDDLVERYAVQADHGVEVMVLGTISAPGTGCFCPESALLKALLQHLVLEVDRVVVIDMEAGLEHLGRSTLQGVDVLLVVVEPGRRSVETAERIAAMARELGIRRVLAVLNKVSSPRQEAEVRDLLLASGLECPSSIPFDARLVEADLAGIPSRESGANEVIAAIEALKEVIEERVSAADPLPLKVATRR